MKIISLIIPLLNEEEVLPQLYKRIVEIRKKHPLLKIQLIFIDDGSTDGSLETLKRIAKVDNDVSIISLSRNFGSHAAICAGLNYTNADAVVILSADLQSPPEIIEKMIPLWQDGSDIVWAVREGRGDPWISRFTAAIYYRLMQRFALSNYPEKGIDYCLLDRKVYKFIASLKERNTNIFGLILWSGFKQTFVSYRRDKRQGGFSKWSFGKKLKLLIDSFVSFSLFPMRLVTYLGLIFAVFSSIYIVMLVINYFQKSPVDGWTALAALISGGFALVFFMLGIIGEYLWRTFDESRKRPLYIINEILNIKHNNN